MSDDSSKPRSKADEELEREIRKERKFSAVEALGRMAGPGAMKGASPITRKQQAEAQIQAWLEQHLCDAGGPLQVVLLRQIGQSETLLSQYDQPLVALTCYCQRVLASEPLLNELVRGADFEWGRLFGERPHFDKEGCSPDADDPYTIASVRVTLSTMIQQLGGTGA